MSEHQSLAQSHHEQDASQVVFFLSFVKKKIDGRNSEKANIPSYKTSLLGALTTRTSLDFLSFDTNEMFFRRYQYAAPLANSLEDCSILCRFHPDNKYYRMHSLHDSMFCLNNWFLIFRCSYFVWAAGDCYLGDLAQNGPTTGTSDEVAYVWNGRFDLEEHPTHLLIFIILLFLLLYTSSSVRPPRLSGAVSIRRRRPGQVRPRNLGELDLPSRGRRGQRPRLLLPLPAPPGQVPVLPPRGHLLLLREFWPHRRWGPQPARHGIFPLADESPRPVSR